MARSRRTPAMLVGRCSSELSSHKLRGQIKKVTSSDRSVPRFPASRHCATTTYAAFFQGKPHEVYQRRQPRQEMLGVAKWRDLLFFPAPAFVARSSFQTLGFPSTRARICVHSSFIPVAGLGGTQQNLAEPQPFLSAVSEPWLVRSRKAGLLSSPPPENCDPFP